LPRGRNTGQQEEAEQDGESRFHGGSFVFGWENEKHDPENINDIDSMARKSTTNSRGGVSSRPLCFLPARERIFSFWRRDSLPAPLALQPWV
jgi:hypothetical protein